MRIAEKEVGPPVGSGTSCPRDVGVARVREREVEREKETPTLRPISKFRNLT